MKPALNHFHKTIKEFLILWHNFSFAYAFYGLIWWLCFYLRPSFSNSLSTWAIRKKTYFLDRYIGQYYADILDRYKTNPPEAIPAKNYTIWLFWGQGEKEMPPLIKACYRQLTYFNPNVTLVTVDNVGSFINLSPVILTKVKDGRLSLAHFSDIVRTTLLAKHGGLWLDATVWVSNSLPINKFSKMTIFTASGHVPVSNKSIRFWTSFEWNWSSWCLGSGEEKNLLFSFVSEMLQAIAEREKAWPDYVIQDYLIHYACRTFPSVKEAMENMPIECKNRNKFAKMMNAPFDRVIYDKLINSDLLFKLSFRTQWNKTDLNGDQTFYGRVLSDTIAPESPEKVDSANKNFFVQTDI